MITEDYVSFETAKLLKEKRFPQSAFRCHYIISEDGNSHYKKFEDRCGFGDYDIIAPTLAVAMKWLREVHNIFIEISVDEMLRDKGYQWALYDNNTKEIMPYSGWGNTYEESCESAIKYYLENLI